MYQSLKIWDIVKLQFPIQIYGLPYI